MIGRKSVFWCAWFILFFSMGANAQPEKERWVDSIFQTLSENEKIAQLFMVRFSSHFENDVVKGFEKKIDLGGLVLTTGSPIRQANLLNRFQSAASVPLLIAQDASSGLGFSRDSAVTFPSPLVQGAINDDSIVYHIARDIARQMRLTGVHMSLSPNATPVHSQLPRSNDLFGDNPEEVSRKSLLHLQGLRAEGILSCAKYFPLKNIEVIDDDGDPGLLLYHDTLVSRPYRALFENGLNAVMPDASPLPLYFGKKLQDPGKSISPESVARLEAGDLVRAPLWFKGIVMIDLRLMEHSGDLLPGDAGLFAFRAGADMMISDDHPDDAIRKIRKLIHSEKAFADRLDEKVRRVLALKYDAGLSSPQQIDTEYLSHRLLQPESKVLRMRALRKSVTVVRNDAGVLPISIIENKTFACLIAGDSTSRADIFHRSVRKYVQAERIDISAGIQQTSPLRHDVVIVAIFPGTSGAALQNLMGALQEIGPHQHVIVADFGCATFEQYAPRFSSLIAAYTDDPDLAGIVPQVIFGATPGRGVLPIAYAGMKSGTSVRTDDLRRLEYSFPEDAGVDGATLGRIEQIAREAISSGSTPGCYVLVAKGGKVIYDQAFGHLTYDRTTPVSDETIYDLASLTKVAATLQAVMFLHEHGIIDIHKKLSVYLPELKGTNKKDITIADILAHQAGLAPFVPLWPLTVEGPAPKPFYYSSQQNVSYPLQIAPSLFGSPILRDSVWSWIAHSKMMDKPVRTPYQYRYSDLGFMMLKHLAERTLNQPMEDFLRQNFYDPLGANSLGYTPLDRFPANMIAPTELDTLFRGGLLIGTVHDERAAMLGGVSGHAGLFGTANDLSKLGQMLLEKGSYGGLRYYKPETVELFTAKYYESSRRGLGWDKPVQNEWKSPTSLFVSPLTFGHTGFTGTCLWVDPTFDLVYIFLSNRVFPDRSDKLIQANIRSRIQDVIYEAIFNFCKTNESVTFE